MNLTDQIPGLAEAIEQEQLVRHAAFLDLPETLCGRDVPALTLRHVLILESIQSPLVVGGFVQLTDLAAFFLTLLPARGWRRFWLLRFIAKLDLPPSIAEISDYMREGLQDAPGGESGGNFISYFSNAAIWVDALAHEYGWPEPVILNLPLKRLFQYAKVIARRNGDPILFNPSDKVRGQWLAQVNKRN
jgi:hypothetical protein